MSDLVEPSDMDLSYSPDSVRKYIEELEQRIKELEQAIMSNCYDDPSTSGKRLMALATKRGEKL